MTELIRDIHLILALINTLLFITLASRFIVDQVSLVHKKLSYSLKVIRKAEYMDCFTDGMLVTSLGKSLYDTLFNNKNEFIDVCKGEGFEAAGYTCKHCGSEISIDSRVKLCYECYYSIYPKLERKIYFTVKTNCNTYYYESDCIDSLKVDLMRVRYAPEVISSNIQSITYSNTLPKGILL